MTKNRQNVNHTSHTCAQSLENKKPYLNKYFNPYACNTIYVRMRGRNKSTGVDVFSFGVNSIIVLFSFGVGGGSSNVIRSRFCDEGGGVS